MLCSVPAAALDAASVDVDVAVVAVGGQEIYDGIDLDSILLFHISSFVPFVSYLLIDSLPCLRRFDFYYSFTHLIT